MRPSKYTKSELYEVEHCPSRVICPIGELCSASPKEGDIPLFPRITEVNKDSLIWTNLRHENSVHFIQSGVYSCVAHFADDWEIPFGLYGKGNVVGMVELYAPESISDDYHLKVLIPGKIYTLPGNLLRQKLESMSFAEAQQVMSGCFANVSASVYAQAKILSGKSLYNRILFLLLSIRDLANRADKDHREIPLTHEEIAQLVAADRASTTRVLKKMREDGVIELGYKTVVITYDGSKMTDENIFSGTCFYTDDENIISALREPWTRLQE